MKKAQDDALNRPTSRRRFAKAVAAALVAAPVASVAAHAQTTAPKEPKAPPNPQPTPTASPQPQKLSPLADTYTEAARIRFGQQITPEEFERLKEELEDNVRTAERLRSFKLQNSDEPDFVFGA